MHFKIAGLVVVAAAVAACSTGSGTTEDPELAVEQRDPETIYRLDPESGSVLGEMPILARISVGQGYGRVAIGRDVWVLNSIDQSLSRVDDDSNTVEATVAFPGGDGSGDLALAGGDPWVSDPSHNRIIRVDRRTEAVAAAVRVRLLPQGLAVADGDLWVANHHGRPSGSVWRIDPRHNRVVARIRVGNTTRYGPQWMAAGAGSIWVGVPGLQAVVRIDPVRNKIVATVPVADGGVCGQIVADDDAVWVASGGCGEGALTRIDPITNEVVARITSPHWTAVFGGALGFGSLWIGTDGGPFEVDPVSNEIVSRLALADGTAFGGDLAAGAGSLWMHDGEHQTLIRIDPTAP